MNIRDFSKPLTAELLNNSLAKQFGQKINLSKFTTEELQDVRNKLRTKMSQTQTTESYDTTHSLSHQKNVLFLNVLNAELKERTYIQLEHAQNRIVTEGEEQRAEIIMAAKDMVDRVTGWMEDSGEMRTESMLDLADAIRDELGDQVAEQFVSSVRPALEQMYDTLEQTRKVLDQNVSVLAGEGEMPVPLGSEEEPNMEEPANMEAPMEPIETDDFASAEASAGGAEPIGREKRESVDYNARRLKKK